MTPDQQPRPTMPSTSRRPALILRILGVLAALVGLGVFFFYAGISVLFFSYFKTLNVLCVLAGVIGGFLCVLKWATGRRTFARIGAFLLCASIAVPMGAAVWRWATHDRYDTVPSTGTVNWWRFQPFENDNALPHCEAPAQYRFEGLPCLRAAYALYPIEAAAVQALARRELYETQRWKVSLGGSHDLFERLARSGSGPHDCDAVFGLAPSDGQRAEAETNGVSLALTPVARDAFVFFVHADNPVTNLTTSQIRDIYSGRAKSWRDVGVPFDARLMPFQRNKNSGSQTTLERLMGDEPILPPIQEDRLGGMGEIFQDVADYQNRRGAIGFSFRYYATELVEAGKVRLLAIDGAAPTVENIRSGAYPFVTDSYLVTAGPPEGDVARLAAFLRSPEGRRMVEDIGYVAP